MENLPRIRNYFVLFTLNVAVYATFDYLSGRFEWYERIAIAWATVVVVGVVIELGAARGMRLVEMLLVTLVQMAISITVLSAMPSGPLMRLIVLWTIAAAVGILAHLHIRLSIAMPPPEQLQ